jgi:hypothetical protein
MTSSRNWKFPVLIGGAIVAAGILFYFGHARVNSNATQGAIAHRDVYRDADVKPGDVGTPGEAPVAVTAVLQSSNFKELAKNPAFQSLLNNQSFQQIARQGAFFALLKDASFHQMMANAQFQAVLQNQAQLQQLRVAMSANSTADLRASLSTGLTSNAAFNNLLRNPAFAQLINQASFVNLVNNNVFARLMNSSAFLALANNSSFQNAMMQGQAAQLSTAMMRE